MRFIVSLVAVLTALGVGVFAFPSVERTIAVPALAIASPQVAPESRSVAAPSRHTPVSQLAHKEVVLTFDDGPWPSTPAVLKALTDECLKATFFEIGEHATWHPEITKQVIDAGMTVGTHTWSHEDLARNPYAKHLEQAEQEVEMGNSAVHMAAAGGKIAPFFRFPELQHLPQLLSYLAERNIAIFSTDIDSRDFTMHKPDQVVKSVMSQLEKHGKGIILMHDLHRNTAEALPELISQLKAGGYKVVHMVPNGVLARARENAERRRDAVFGSLRAHRLDLPTPTDLAPAPA